VSVHNALDEAFQQGRAESRALCMPYLTAGFPGRDTFVDLCLAILEAGADALEIGIPFSDPLLDGPSIQRSQQAALEAGTTPTDCLRFAAEIRRQSDKPLLFMGAFNPVMAFGMEAFCASAHDAGVSALIIPDLPHEEQDELRRATESHTLHLIQLVAPTSTQDRLRRVCAAASGFVYCISVAGVTGVRSSVVETAQPLVARVREHTDVPVAVGFGIAGPEQARAVGAFADGVAVGSAIVDAVAEGTPEERSASVRSLVGGIVAALDRAPSPPAPPPPGRRGVT